MTSSPRSRLERIQESYLTRDEWRRLFEQITNVRDRALFLTAYRHGLRASEVGLLRVYDADIENGKLAVRRLKASLPGLQLMESDEVKMLKAYLKTRWSSVKMKGPTEKSGWTLSASPPVEEPLFISNRQQAISRRMLDVLMKRYAAAANLPKEKRHFHCLKHSVATHLLEAGMRIEWVQDWLGHADIKNTQIYAKLTNRTRDEGAREAFSRLDRF